MNRPPTRSLAWACGLTLAVLGLAPGSSALAQPGGNDQLTKILTDPDKLEELKKERLRPPIEFFRSQVMPNDVLPYLKANHWSMLGLELRSNHDDYEGMLQSRPVGLAGQPNEVVYRRDARLVKGQRARLTLPMLLPVIPKEIGLQLIRPEAIRQDEEWLASLRILEPHQQMVVVASKNPNDPYSRWSSMRATTPSSGRKDDPMLADKQRYYRMVLPLEPDKPLLSAHPLTWSPISHLIWDGLPPEAIGVGQQQAIVDWLHWGGQIVVVGGAGPAYAPLRESFLAPFLPAEPTGENVLRSGAELQPLSEAYPPPAVQVDADEPVASNISYQDAFALMGRRYRPPAAIATAAKKPIYFAALRPKAGAVAIPLGGAEDPPLAVEWKVGRGRVVMLAFSLTDPDLVGWPGFDTLVRRVVLRRPEERQAEKVRVGAAGGFLPPVYEKLNGLDLTTVRYLSRDLGAPTREAVDEDGGTAYQPPQVSGSRELKPQIEVPVGEWLDSAELPSLARDKLEKASGIEIPNSRFVLKVILAYILALVPLNWLICRYILGRREWAWVVVPTLSLAFAVGVERAAAYDVGYDSSCDEIDLIETQGAYPRGHLSRFASIYSTGRVRYSISYPNDPTALALPLATGRSLRGEDLSQSSFQTLPNPALTGFQVQPRSLALFRAEQMASLPGTVSLANGPDGALVVANDSGLELNDSWVVEVRPGNEKLKAARVGAIAQGQKLPVGELATLDQAPKPPEGQLDPRPFLDLLLERAVAQRPEEVGELRLIAWAAKPMAGQAIEPPVDRQRGFTLVVAHLRPSPLLDSASPRYNMAVVGGEVAPSETDLPPGARQGAPNSMINMGRGRGGRGGRGQPPSQPSPAGPATPPPTPDAPSTPALNAPETPRS